MRRWRRHCALLQWFSRGRFATKMHCFLCTVCACFLGFLVLTSNFLSSTSTSSSGLSQAGHKQEGGLGAPVQTVYDNNGTASSYFGVGPDRGEYVVPLVRNLDRLPSGRPVNIPSSAVPSFPSQPAEVFGGGNASFVQARQNVGSDPHQRAASHDDSTFFEREIQASFPNGGIHSVELKNIARKCGGKNIRRPTNYDSGPYLINEPDFCTGEIFLLIAVHSNAPNTKRRDLIRRTWASLRQINDYRLMVLFFLGNSANADVQRAVETESRTYRDIVQRDFREHYRNMTRKHLTIMRWVASHCSHAKYLLKADDDTFVDVFHVVHFLEIRSPRKFICKKISGKPIRSSRSNMRKWLVTKEEYAEGKYPWYCEGFGYLMDISVAKQLYWCSVYTKFFWIDDVYVTGVLREKLHLDLEGFWSGHSWANVVPSFASEKMMDTMFLIASHNEVMPELWWRIWKSVIRFSFGL